MGNCFAGAILAAGIASLIWLLVRHEPPTPEPFVMEQMLDEAVRTQRLVIIYVVGGLSPLGGVVREADEESISLLFYEGPSNDPLWPLIVSRNQVVAIEWMSDKDGPHARDFCLHNRFQAVMGLMSHKR